ncbi:MAG: winged helix-turn-helix transcriptional regulator [Marinicaulis sp.]|nr:winged helix-turn-helix transcriptional regulator [Marinicaulis sp.]
MVEYNHGDELALDGTLGALADPTRRAILAALGQGERRVTEIAAPFEMSLNAVSKHIKKLETAGLVRRRRVGRDHFLSADPKPINDAADWFAAQRVLWNARLDKLEQLITAEADDE